MSVAEYGAGIYRDFFQVDENISEFNFPCSVCKFRTTAFDSEPCCYCDHHNETKSSFFCCLCGEHTVGDSQSDQFHLARKTPASIGPVCLTCKATIAEDPAYGDLRKSGGIGPNSPMADEV